MRTIKLQKNYKVNFSLDRLVFSCPISKKIARPFIDVNAQLSERGHLNIFIFEKILDQISLWQCCIEIRDTICIYGWNNHTHQVILSLEGQGDRTSINDTYHVFLQRERGGKVGSVSLGPCHLMWFLVTPRWCNYGCQKNQLSCHCQW